MKRKLVYIINSLKTGGPVNMLYNLVKYMDTDRWDITVLALNPCNTNYRRDFSKLNCNIIELEKEKNIRKRMKKISSIIEGINPDIIHSHGGKADYICSKFSHNYCTYTTIHCVPHEDFVFKQGYFLGHLKAFSFYYIMKKIGNLVACSKTVADKINGLHGYNNIKYVQNGIDQESFCTSIDKNLNIRNELGISSDKLVYVFCGYLSKRKNVEFLIEAWEKSENHKSLLLIIGDGPQYNELKNRVNNNNRIIMLGKRLEISRYLTSADYFISSSLSEGLPLAVMEGLAVGLPAILSNIPSHLEIKDLGSEAIDIFSLENIDTLIKIIQEKEGKQVSESNKIAARSIIEEKLNAKEMALSYENLYIKSLNDKI